MQLPDELCSRSPRQYRGLQKRNYPFLDGTITVTACGRICMGKLKVHFSTAFAGQNADAKQIDDKIWIISFMKYDLAFFDREKKKI